ncbi:MAG TPA: enoyl-CoA hydratase-related protein [Blastocatellia bacterium]|nr:enoyl-CoA hydratase-related protein [Blastocatellia bacterium]
MSDSNLRKPVIGKLDGIAAGKDLLRLLDSSFAIATEKSGIVLPLDLPNRDEAQQFISSIVAESQRLKLPFEKLMAGGAITAYEAMSIGLISQVVKDNQELEKVCSELEDQMNKHAPLAMSFAIEAAANGLSFSLEEALQKESELFSRCFETEDMREGIRAFQEKREPLFTGK